MKKEAKKATRRPVQDVVPLICYVLCAIQMSFCPCVHEWQYLFCIVLFSITLPMCDEESKKKKTMAVHAHNRRDTSVAVFLFVRYFCCCSYHRTAYAMVETRGCNGVRCSSLD
mmetsp:Transcript_37673/g.97191  ORF Transcript_37673/g.97191 Transcript_37673/m.97191 type:complete len:113 (-) Transcript_37673:37-375(-)